MREMDELIDHARRHHASSMQEFAEKNLGYPALSPRLTMHFDPRFPLGPGCTARAVTFGDPPGMPILVPSGMIPVLNAEGTEVTLQPVDGGCSECGVSLKVEIEFSR
jgi:hypothetical protein